MNHLSSADIVGWASGEACGWEAQKELVHNDNSELLPQVRAWHYLLMNLIHEKHSEAAEMVIVTVVT